MPPSSATSKKAAPTELSDGRFAVRFAETDQDCITIHRFLCMVAGPVLFCPIDAEKSMSEILRVRDEGVSIMASFDDLLVGALGLVSTTWWYGHGRFLTDRWFFTLPQLHHLGVAGRLQAEAQLIAKDSNMDLVINGKMRRRSNRVAYTLPSVTPQET